MTSLGSWISPSAMQSLGWALIHSLWQGMAVAALAAALMALCRRPSTRYLLGTGALAAMLAAPVTTFFILRSPEPSPSFLASSGPPASIFLLRNLNAPINASVAATTEVARKIAPVTSAGATRFLPSQDVLPWLVGAWLLGVTLFSLRFAGGFLLLEHKRRSQSSAPSAQILEICREMQRRLGLNRAIQYLECSWLQAPAVIGWLRPIVLLPVIALTGFSEEQLRAVIAHELAHIRRLDSFVNLFQILVETLLFYHPAIWWLNKRIRTERELCCDEIAVSSCGNPIAYARALALMEEWSSAPILAMAANRGSLSERVLYVLDRKSIDTRARIVGLTGGLVFLTAALAAGSASFKVAYPIAAFDVREISRAVLPPANLPQRRATQDAWQIAAVKNSAGAKPAKSISGNEPGSPSGAALPLQQSSTLVTQSLPLTAAPISNQSQAEVTLPRLSLNAPTNPSASAASPADQALTDGAARTESASAVAREPQGKPVDPLVNKGQPIGVGDPNTTICRKPEHLPGSNGADQIVCMKNTYWFALWIRGEALGADGKTILEPLNAPVVAHATGEGNPDEVVCQKSSEQTASRLPSPKLCFRNRYWAGLKRKFNLSPGPPDEQLISALSRG